MSAPPARFFARKPRVGRVLAIAGVMIAIAEPLLLYAGGVSASGPFLPQLLRETSIEPRTEVRALWVVRDALKNPAAIDRMIDFAVRARFHLLFVQVRGRGDAFYRSATEPPATELQLRLKDFDPLEYVLIRAHNAGIAVHAWINVNYVWSDPARNPPPAHILAEHSDWALADESGARMTDRNIRWWQSSGCEGYYVSPAAPGVRDHIAGVVRELVEHYPIDGVHLDYIRFPSRAFGGDRVQRTNFMLSWGIDPAQFRTQRSLLEKQIGESVVAAGDSAYTDWRAAQVESTVTAIRRVCGPLPLSAAVFPEPQGARYDKGQDWVWWLRSGLVDFVVPMAYNYDAFDLDLRLRAIYNTVGRDGVLVGLAIHEGRDRHFDENVAAVQNLRAEGICIFSYNVLSEMRFADRFLSEAWPAPPDTLAVEADSTGTYDEEE